FVARFQNVEVGVHLGNVDLPIGPHWGALGVSPILERSPPKRLAGCGVEAMEASVLVADIESAVMNSGGAVANLDTWFFPHQGRLTIFDLRGVEANHLAEDVTIQIFGAVTNVDSVPFHDRRTTQPA